MDEIASNGSQISATKSNWQQKEGLGNLANADMHYNVRIVLDYSQSMKSEHIEQTMVCTALIST